MRRLRATVKIDFVIILVLSFDKLFSYDMAVCDAILYI